MEAQQSIAPYLSGGEARDDEHRYTIDNEVRLRLERRNTVGRRVRRKGCVSRCRKPAITIYVAPLSLYLAKIAAIHDYVGIVPMRRGKRSSPDVIAPWEHEVKDTYGVIDWISRQRWSNGKVGMYGASYDGFTQWPPAALASCAQTIVPDLPVSPVSAYRCRTMSSRTRTTCGRSM